MDHMIKERAISHAVAKPGLFEIVRSQRHAFHAAGHHHFRISRLNGLSGQHHRFQPGTANLVDGQAFDLRRQTRQHRRLPGRVLPIAAGKNLAHHHFIHLLGCNPSSLHRFGNNDGTLSGRPNRG